MAKQAPDQIRTSLRGHEGAVWFDRGTLNLGVIQLDPNFIAGDGDRIAAVLTVAFHKRCDQNLLRHVQAAAAHSRRGADDIANLRLALAGLARIKAAHDLPLRLSWTETLLAGGMPGAALIDALDDAEGVIAKFDPAQPRVPAGSGRKSGQWTSSGASSQSAFLPLTASVALARAAPLLSPTLGVETLAALSTLAESVGFAAVLGVLFIPTPNNAVTSGALPGDSGLTYRFDGPAGVLQVKSADGTVVAAATLQSGVFTDVQTGLPFGRWLPSGLMLDSDMLAAIQQQSDARRDPRAAVAPQSTTTTDDQQPKLCPDPGPDQPGSEIMSDRAKAYQQQISAFANPQRGPLPIGWASNLYNFSTGKLVHFDDCAEATGIMVEAKGLGYAGLLANVASAREKIDNDWLSQSLRQVQAAGARPIEWYFAEPEAASYATRLFSAADDGREKIAIKIQPPVRQ